VEGHLAVSNQFQGSPASAALQNLPPPVVAGSGKEFDPLSTQKPANGTVAINRAVNSVDAGLLAFQDINNDSMITLRRIEADK